MKRVVLLEWKETNVAQVFKSVSDLVRHEGMAIGIGKGALWNALSKNGGKYENKVCRIQYKEIE
ncbi:MAG: hypothetical protein IIT64_10205 [Bacteroidaceae bacterium]|nr:hypothetical protein [Bacteroidaceae bacterium]